LLKKLNQSSGLTGDDFKIEYDGGKVNISAKYPMNKSQKLFNGKSSSNVWDGGTEF